MATATTPARPTLRKHRKQSLLGLSALAVDDAAYRTEGILLSFFWGSSRSHPLRTQVAMNAGAKQDRIFESSMDWPSTDCPRVQLVLSKVLFVRNPFFQPAL